jgi:hypothetical protein
MHGYNSLLSSCVPADAVQLVRARDVRLLLLQDIGGAIQRRYGHGRGHAGEENHYLNVKETEHGKLVAAARIWLRSGPRVINGGTSYRQRCSVVVSEIKALTAEEPDVLGWYDMWTHLVEVKASRSDFLSDKKKPFRAEARLGMGDYRWYFTIDGVVKPEDQLPPGWGLVIYDVDRVTAKILRPAEHQPAKHVDGEVLILTSLLKRIGQVRPRGINIRCHTHVTKNSAVLEMEVDDGSSEYAFATTLDRKEIHGEL